jgi:hypothetical protein
MRGLRLQTLVFSGILAAVIFMPGLALHAADLTLYCRASGGSETYPYDTYDKAFNGLSSLAAKITEVNAGYPTGSNYDLVSAQNKITVLLDNGLYTITSSISLPATFVTNANYHINIQNISGQIPTIMSSPIFTYNGFDIYADYTHITGLTMYQVNYTFYVYADNCIFNYITIPDADFGWRIEDADYNCILNSIVTFTWLGINIRQNCDYTTVDNCTVYYNNTNGGIYCGYNTEVGTTIRNCTIHSNQNYGIYIRGTIGAAAPYVITNNVFYDNGSNYQSNGIYVSSATASRIWIKNNTFYNHSTAAVYFVDGSQTNFCCNNIISIPNSGTSYGICLVGATANFFTGCNYNCFYRLPDGNGAGNVGFFNGVAQQALTTWRAATGYDANSFENSDPYFANVTAGSEDFHLKSTAGRWTGISWANDSVTSPCIDAGDPSSPYTNETGNNGGRVNQGAYGNTVYASRTPGGGGSGDAAVIYDGTLTGPVVSTYTMGFRFTVGASDLQVTSLMGYGTGAVKTSIWFDNGDLVASGSFSSPGSTWNEVSASATLYAGNTYRIGVYTTYWYYMSTGNPGARVYDSNKINATIEGYWGTGDGIPSVNSGTTIYGIPNFRYSIVSDATPPVVTNPHLQAGSSHTAGDGLSVSGAIVAGCTSLYVDYDSITEANPDCTGFLITVTGGSGAGFWQTDTTDSATPAPSQFTGLTLHGAAKLTCAVGHKDKNGNYGQSASMEYIVKPYQPLAPTVLQIPADCDSLSVNINPHASESALVEYAVYCITTGQWVQSDGTLGAAAVWRTDFAWAVTTLNGLTLGTYYSFQVRSRNFYNNSIYSEFSPAAGATVAGGASEAALIYDGTLSVPISSTNTMGFRFTVGGSDLQVTSLLGYGTGAVKTSIWFDNGDLVASGNFVSPGSTWNETPAPATLYAGLSYRIGVYTTSYYSMNTGNPGVRVYDSGKINATIDGYYSAGDSFPSIISTPTVYGIVNFKYSLINDTNPPAINNPHFQAGSLHTAGDGLSVSGAIVAGCASLYVDYDSITEANPDCTSFQLEIQDVFDDTVYDAADSATPAPALFSFAPVSGADRLQCRVGHKDKYGNYSEALSSTYYVNPYQPQAPAVAAVTGNGTVLNVNVLPHASENALVEHSIYCITTGQYVQTDGSLGSTSAWNTDAGWGTIRVTGLSAETQYGFRVQSRNLWSLSVLSEWSAVSECSTYYNTFSGIPDTLYINNGWETAQGGRANPFDLKDATPCMSAIYRDDNISAIAIAVQVQVGTDNDWTTAEIWTSGWLAFPTATPIPGERMPDVTYAGSALSFSTTYYWRIRVRNSSAAVSEWSDGNWFMIVPAYPPDAATGPDPANGATGVALAPTLTWNAANGADGYTVYFGTSQTPGLVDNTINLFYVPGTLLEGTTYYWRVDAYNGDGVTDGTLWHFTTCIMPSKATGPDPENGAVDVPVDCLLRWNSSTNCDGYVVYFGNSSTALDNVGVVAFNIYMPPTLKRNTRYYWRVDAYNGAGVTTGDLWTFKTAALPGVDKKKTTCGCMIPANEPMETRNIFGGLIPILIFTAIYIYFRRR